MINSSVFESGREKDFIVLSIVLLNFVFFNCNDFIKLLYKNNIMRRIK